MGNSQDIGREGCVSQLSPLTDVNDFSSDQEGDLFDFVISKESKSERGKKTKRSNSAITYKSRKKNKKNNKKHKYEKVRLKTNTKKYDGKKRRKVKFDDEGGETLNKSKKRNNGRRRLKKDGNGSKRRKSGLFNRVHSAPNIKARFGGKKSKKWKRKKGSDGQNESESLEFEIDEIEIELAQKNHQNSVLKKENKALRAKIEYLKSKYIVNDDLVITISGPQSSSPSSLNNLTLVNNASNTTVSSISALSEASDIEIDEIDFDLDEADDVNLYALPPIRPTLPPLSLPSITESPQGSYDIADLGVKHFAINNNKGSILRNISSLRSMSLPQIEHNTNTPFNDECKSISTCLKIKRIIIALKWYKLYNVKGDIDELYNKIVEKKYNKYLLHDYDHLLSKHFVDEYPLIINQIDDELKICNGNSCYGLKRFKINVHQKKHDNDTDKQKYVACLDFIHCYLIHKEQFN